VFAASLDLGAGDSVYFRDCYQGTQARRKRKVNSPLLKVARVLVRFNHVARIIVSANHSIM
jgi:hypothetical protein